MAPVLLLFEFDRGLCSHSELQVLIAVAMFSSAKLSPV